LYHLIVMIELNPTNSNTLLSPDKAKMRLEFMGFAPSMWDESLSESGSLGSHELRALIRIARGGRSRSLQEVYEKERERDDLLSKRK